MCVLPHTMHTPSPARGTLGGGSNTTTASMDGNLSISETRLGSNQLYTGDSGHTLRCRPLRASHYTTRFVGQAKGAGCPAPSVVLLAWPCYQLALPSTVKMRIVPVSGLRSHTMVAWPANGLNSSVVHVSWVMEPGLIVA